MIDDLEALLAPLGAAAFFSEHWERRHLHLPAAGGARREPLVTHEELLVALAREARGGGAPAGVVAFPEQVGATLAELLGEPATLEGYLATGHPLVWNRARGVSPAIDAVSAMLARTLGAHVWPNVYATGAAGTPFDIHFDAHEVIALQCEGAKDWTLSEVRVDRPLDAKEMEPAIEAALRARRDEAASRVAATFTTRPGDLVYIPRGQFHNARTAPGSEEREGGEGARSLHVTFGIQLPSPFDAARRALAALLMDPRMREYLPPLPLDPDGRRAAAILAEAAAGARAALSPGALAEAAGEIRDAFS